jgi:hypothetical protein
MAWPRRVACGHHAGECKNSRRRIEQLLVVVRAVGLKHIGSAECWTTFLRKLSVCSKAWNLMGV